MGCVLVPRELIAEEADDLARPTGRQHDTRSADLESAEIAHAQLQQRRLGVCRETVCVLGWRSLPRAQPPHLANAHRPERARPRRWRHDTTEPLSRFYKGTALK